MQYNFRLFWRPVLIKKYDACNQHTKKMHSYDYEQSCYIFAREKNNVLKVMCLSFESSIWDKTQMHWKESSLMIVSRDILHFKYFYTVKRLR